MKVKIIIISIITIASLWSCSSSMQQLWVRENFQGKKFQKMLVMGIAKDAESTTTFENSIVEQLEKNGINATNSSTIFPTTFSKTDLSEKQIGENIKNGNYDGVLVSYLVDIKTREISITGPEGYNSSVSNYQNYINNGYNLSYTDKDFFEEKSYVMETRLFDISDLNDKQSMVWSGQYSLTDPRSFYQGSKEYAEQLVKTLVKSGLIKKK